MGSPVLQTTPLGARWPTIDPFLFCAHHDDAYPAGDERLAPVASLEGRELGQDFSGRDGWSMYHGLVVPGFPAHPHRGFETVTFVRRGVIDHADSLGAAARFGRGDVQWVTAGKGIVHSEMFPLLSPDPATGNPLELFQIWLNLPAADKLVDPYFTMLWGDSLPVVSRGGGTGAGAAGRVDVTVIAGAFEDVEALAPPPSSWAARPSSDVAIWHLRMDPGASVSLPAARGGAEVGRVLYVFEGAGAQVADVAVPNDTGVAVAADQRIEVVAGTGGPDVEILVLQGRPIGEPVAQYGPFVMNTEAEIREAFADYRATSFGGWPWPSDAPTHGRDDDRFARVSEPVHRSPGPAALQ